MVDIGAPAVADEEAYGKVGGRKFMMKKETKKAQENSSKEKKDAEEETSKNNSGSNTIVKKGLKKPTMNDQRDKSRESSSDKLVKDDQTHDDIINLMHKDYNGGLSERKPPIHNHQPLLH
ncbi:hypothetical protein M9H77_28878 [Catharanthus roseus]|uniref:Uncharacterized protein n=1 Tax=Catharanthus roseus TaxID=4058 RepID=A0ACC0AGV0_CATRO|nr:hypothetical protein M9H77_28878 [Catharanthus roseus]